VFKNIDQIRFTAHVELGFRGTKNLIVYCRPEALQHKANFFPGTALALKPEIG